MLHSIASHKGSKISNLLAESLAIYINTHHYRIPIQKEQSHSSNMQDLYMIEILYIMCIYRQNEIIIKSLNRQSLY